MESRHLRYAIALAEHQHFGRAAKSLGIAQPPLSKQIRDLENELGTALFVRTSRGVFPTDAGEAFLSRAAAALKEMTAASTDAARAARGELGRLRIGFIGSALLELLPGLLSAFRESHPRVQLDMRERSSRAAAEGLAAGELDIAVTRGAPRGRGAERMTSVHMGRERVVVMVSATHPFAGSDSVSISQIDGQPLIMSAQSEEPTMLSSVLNTFGELLGHPLQLDSFTEGGDIHTIVGLAACGLGIGLGPSCIRAALRPNMWICELEPAIYLPELVLSYRTDDRSSVLRTFLEITAQQHPTTRNVVRRSIR